MTQKYIASYKSNFCKSKKGVTIWVSVTTWVLGEFRIVDIDSNIRISLILEIAFVIYRIFIHRENDANKEKQSETVDRRKLWIIQNF